MKKLILLSLLLFLGVGLSFAQDEVKTAEVKQLEEKQSDVKQAEIKFDKTTHDFGEFSEDSPVVKCTFTFTNTGNAPLVINQAIASCGCTVPSYTKEPIRPGETGTIEITYNGHGKLPDRRFKKSIIIRSNAKNSTVRIYVSGFMKKSSK